MIYLQILSQIVQLLVQFFNLWKAGGSIAVKEILKDHHKQTCDQICQLELKREAQKDL